MQCKYCYRDLEGKELETGLCTSDDCLRHDEPRTLFMGDDVDPSKIEVGDVIKVDDLDNEDVAESMNGKWFRVTQVEYRLVDGIGNGGGFLVDLEDGTEAHVPLLCVIGHEI